MSKRHMPTQKAAAIGRVDQGIHWRRLLAGAALGALALLLAGALPLPEAWSLRGLACGLVLGLSVRSAREILPAVGLSTVAGLIAMGLFSLSPSARNLTAVQPSDVFALVAACAAGAAMIGWVCSLGRIRAATLAALAILVGLQLYQMGVLPGVPREATASIRARVTSEPVAEAYQFDGDLFIRIDHLMAKGVPYYAAFLQAYDEDSRLQGPPPGLFGVRQRWVFELWNVLPGPPGIRVLWWFDALVVGTMLAGYGVARRFVEPAAALVAPVAIGGYLLMPALTLWFPLSEYWGGMVAVLFLYAMVTERWTWGAILVVVAVSLRELMLFLVPVYVVWWLLSSRRREAVAGLILSVLGPVTLFALHASWSPVVGQSAAGAARWFQGGVQRLVDALQFSGGYVGFSDRAYLVIPLLALVGAVATRAAWIRVLLGAAVIVPIVALTLFSGGEWNYYWGAIAMPMLLALTPLAAGWLVPSEMACLDARPVARTRGEESPVVRWRPGSTPKVPRGGAVLFAEDELGVEPAALVAMEAAWAAGADVVVASRLIPAARSGGTPGERLWRSLALRVVTSLCRCVVPVPGLTDPTSPVVLMSALALRSLPQDARTRLAADGPTAALLASLRQSARVREVPLRASAPMGAPLWGAVGSLAVGRLRRIFGSLQ
jgi:hypothetical protein